MEGVQPMPTLLLPELAKEMSWSSRHLAETVEAESRQLKELREKPEEAEALRRRAPQSARGATSTALGRRANIVDVWRLALEHLEHGLSAEQSREMLQAILSAIDDWLRVVQDCHDLWRLVAEIGGSPAGMEGLEAAEEEVRRVRAAVEKTHDFIARDRPSIDAGLLERGRKEIAEGRYRTADQIRSGCKGAKGEAE
jgi:uncharacterized protein YhaN